MRRSNRTSDENECQKKKDYYMHSGRNFVTRSLEYYIILSKAEIPVSEDTTMLLLAIPRSSSSYSAMKVVALIVMFGASLASSAPSTLSTTTLPKQFQSGAVQTSRYYGPSIYPGYYLYNYLQIDPTRGLPFAIFGDGSQNVAHVQPTYTYFGTPVYDHRYIFNQVFPSLPGFQPPAAVVPGAQPPMIPSQVPIYPTQPPFEDDGIEKLDEKLDPSLEGTAGGHPNDDVDTVTVDAI